MFHSRLLLQPPSISIGEARLNSIRTTLRITNNQQVSVLSRSLPSGSKWRIVRRNLHKIRSWSVLRRWSIAEQPYNNLYLFSRMRRELRSVEEAVNAVQYQPNFRPLRRFTLPLNETTRRSFDVSHVRSTDGIFYPGLSSESIPLEYLLYYFNEECVVPYNSLFYWFLYDINSVLDTNRQRVQQVTVFRRVALFSALVVFLLISIMLVLLISSVITTILNLREMHRSDSKAAFVSGH